MITFTVPGAPIAKGRPRFGRNRKTGKGVVYTPGKTEAYEYKVGQLALIARQNANQRVWSGPIGVMMEFFLPGSPIGRPDLDNLIKILDGCKGVIFNDDAQIISIRAIKYGNSNDPRTIFRFMQLL